MLNVVDPATTLLVIYFAVPCKLSRQYHKPDTPSCNYLQSTTITRKISLKKEMISPMWSFIFHLLYKQVTFQMVLFNLSWCNLFF